MIRVVIESPFGSTPEGERASMPTVFDNVDYLRRCLRDSLRRGEAPFASHALYPQVLDDATPEERAQGMAAGFAWGERADLVAVYIDRGTTPGMAEGIERYRALGIPIEERRINA